MDKGAAKAEGGTPAPHGVFTTIMILNLSLNRGRKLSRPRHCGKSVQSLPKAIYMAVVVE